jgi:hypothetical protein
MTISNNEIKRIKALQQKKFRDESGLFIVEGDKMVEEAVQSGFSVDAVYRKEEIGETAMSRITSLATPSPVWLWLGSQQTIRLMTSSVLSLFFPKEDFFLHSTQSGILVTSVPYFVSQTGLVLMLFSRPRTL